MIKQVIRLVRPGMFLPCFEIETPQAQNILIRPRYISICAADQRYFQGNRPPDVLAQKLPLALFHEAVGEVLHDPVQELMPGTFCVLFPGGVETKDAYSNYREGAFFRSSNADGFCQEVMSLDRRELLPVSNEDVELYVLTEPLSVCCHALRRLQKQREIRPHDRIGIWGDGPLGFMMALVIHALLPENTIFIYGHHDEKLLLFTFATKCYNVNYSYSTQYIDIAFECVGGEKSQNAIQQATDVLSPCGTIVLLGVSENAIPIHTRTWLEKGISIYGSSRSQYEDFINAKNLIDKNYIRGQLKKMYARQFILNGSHELADIMHMDAKGMWKSLINLSL